MSTFVAILIFLMVFILSANTASAANDYNSTRSNTSLAMSKGGVGADTINAILKEIDALREKNTVNPENVARVLKRFNIGPKISQKIVQEFEELQIAERKLKRQSNGPKIK